MITQRFSRPKMPRNKYDATSGGITKYITGGSNSSVLTSLVSSAMTAYRADIATSAQTANSAITATSAQTADSATTATGADKLNTATTVYGNTFDGTQVLTDITANTISGETLYIDGDTQLEGNLETKGNLTVSGTTTTTSINNSDTISTKNLKVTGQADFYSLTVDQVKSVGGAVMFTPADGFEIDYCVEYNGQWYLYWASNDGDEANKNMWQANDQALCMDFNRATTGTSSTISNNYYWALVTFVSSNETDIAGTSRCIDEELGIYDGVEHKKYHFIVLSNTDYDGTISPEIGQSIVMCGNRTDTDRQSAIYISAYDGLDTGITAPFYAQYMGINDYDLASHRQSYFDADSAKFVGDVEVGGQPIATYIGTEVSEQIGSSEHQIQVYTYYKYNTSPSDEGASDTDSDEMTYYGIACSTSSVKPSSGYTWQKKGENTEFYRLLDINSNYYYSGGSVYYSYRWNILHVDNEGASTVSGLPSGLTITYVAPPNTTETRPVRPTQITSAYCNGSVWTFSGSSVYGSETPLYGSISLYNNNVLCDRLTKQLQMPASATLEIKQGLEASITSNVSSLNGEISTLKQTTSSITTNVSNLSGQTTTLQQTVTGISQSVDDINDGLDACGIDIATSSITMTTNNFTLKNQNGDTVLGADEDGNLEVSGAINATSGRFGSVDNVFNLVLDSDNNKFSLKGARAVLADADNNIYYPYQTYGSQTDFEFLSMGSLSSFSTGVATKYDEEGNVTEWANALNPTIDLSTPILGYGEDDTVSRSTLSISPRELVFTTNAQGTTTTDALFSAGAFLCNGTRISFPNIALFRNFSSNTVAKNNGLVSGDIYHTNGTLKIVY